MTPREAAISLLEDAANSQGGGLLTKRQHHESIMSHLQREEQLHKAALEWAKSMPINVTLQSTLEYGKSPLTRLTELANALAEIGLCSRQEEGFSDNVVKLYSKLFIEPKMREACDRPLSVIIDHDGDCNLLNGADGAGCNCTARERQKMQEYIEYLKGQLQCHAVTIEGWQEDGKRKMERIAELEKTIRWNKSQDWGNEAAKYYKEKHGAAIDRIAELEAERNDFKRALDDLGVTPEEARKGAERSREKDRRIAELQQNHGPAIRLAELVPAAYFRGWADGARTGESDSPEWNAEEDWRETAIRKELLAMGEQTPSMTIHDMTQLVCGELPEGYELKIAMENGAGEAVLYLPEEGYIDGTNLADADIEKQVVELVKLAKGEPSEYDPEQP